ncbi:hybrid sensor histidine kinase/response regulator transcription factor [Chitinophaga sp. 22321]|uniref:histidine kinase n=1 Tax=Chitinophaga hostae TaxID=2831022 RepID=A0ABS5IWG9_9BACT|nr:two-component regulator propeller domain-containing protein [Chitinophaga hostae]MBS0027193.1 response regulator [Chitinophaga hostae]
MSTYKFTFLCFFLYLAQISRAQTRHINFTSLSAKDGLLSNTVNAIIKDHYGLMWFATDDGLNKFDGTNFTVYRHRSGDSSSLRANEVLTLHEDKAGNLWIGTSGGGLSLYDRKKDAFIHFPLHANAPQLPPNAVIMDISSDTSGKVWIAQFENLFMLDPATRHISKISLDTETTGSAIRKIPNCIFVDRQQQIWVGTTRGLYCYSPSTGAVKQVPGNKPGNTPDNNIKAIAGDSNGQIWIGTEKGLYTVQPDGAGITPYHSAPGAPLLDNKLVNCIEPDKDHQLWIGTEQGLIILNTSTNTADYYVPDDENIYSLTNEAIKCAYIDQQGIYWLGTLRGGINKYDKNLSLFSFKPGAVFHTDGRQSSIASAFAENSEGNVFVGTDGGGMFEFNRKTGKVLPVNIPLPVKAGKVSIMALHYTREKKLYIGTYALGLLVMNRATGSYKYLAKGTGPNDLNSSDIFCIREDSRGNIWIGTNGEGVNVLKNEQVIARYRPQPGPATSNEKKLPLNGYVRAIEEDAEGNIWIGSHGGGIGVYHPATGQWDVYTQNNSQLPGDKVQALLRDSNGRMWVGTYGGGLSLFDKTRQRFINFCEKDGLQNTTIYQILEDKNGSIWLSTNTGISSFNFVTKKFHNYSHYNGVQNNNFYHTSGIRLSDGELMFGGLEGFNYFTPSDLTVNKNVPVVLLTDLKVANKSIAPGDDGPIQTPIAVADNIRLAYKQNFVLSFVALNYTNPRENYYAYKLEGFDKDWNYTGTANTAAYTNLDPGEYTFHVKAGNSDGIWNPNDTRIKIFVRPPFWRTTYAYLFYLSAICLLLLYSRYRGITRIRKKFLLEQERQEVKRVQELDRLKIKFLTNLSHDFRTPISLIMGPVEQLIAGEKTGNRLDKLNMIKRNSRRLLNLVNQLLDFRKMEERELKLQLLEGDLVSFIKEVTDSFCDFAERKNIRFTFNSGPSVLHVLFDHDKIERILFNLLSNAFKFTLERDTVTVELQLLDTKSASDQQWILIQVKDTGIGIPEDKKEKVFEHFFQGSTSPAILNQGTGIGLSITKEFVKMHGGTINVESEPGQGATFSIQLPLKISTQNQAAPDLVAEEENILPLPELQEAPSQGDAEIFTILLVEDNEDFRFYLKDNLRNSYKVVEATNGKEGWQKALLLHPQLIVSDITMPQMDGISLLQKLKADKRTSHIPVILLTALTNEEQQISGLATGANDYVTKPFNFEILHAKIRNLLHLNHTLKNTYTKQIKLLAPEVARESTEEKLLARIVGHLEENLTDSQLSVESLSKEVGMSRSSLYNKLLELTGQTPVEYIRSYRLEKAAALMKKSDMTIAEIAYQVGFSTPNYFAKSFKTKYNMLPSEFIARAKKDNAHS